MGDTAERNLQVQADLCRASANPNERNYKKLLLHIIIALLLLLLGSIDPSDPEKVDSIIIDDKGIILHLQLMHINIIFGSLISSRQTLSGHIRQGGGGMRVDSTLYK